MGNASGTNFDVFISYAHVDNEPIFPAKHGWVSVLVDNLGRYLAKGIGRREAFSNWYDQQQLKGNQGIRDHIPEQARQSALFLAVLSPGYVSSEFCLRELEAFIETHRGAVAERLFIVEHMPLDDDRRMPDALRDIRKYRFYKLDQNQVPRTFAQPEPLPDEREYFQKIEDIARDMARKLAPISAAKPAKPAKPTVLLAEVTDDLETRRDEVLRYLDQAGIDVLPTTCYRMVRQDFERALASDLGRCTAFVQLLGPIAGKRPPDVPDGFGWLQLELARRTDLPILQWRSPDLDVTKTELPTQRRLLELETVQAMPFEDFKRTVVECVQTALERARTPPAATDASASLLFINADTVDKPNVDAIKDSLGGRFGWAVPLSLYHDDAKPDELQHDMESNLIHSEGMVIVYGAVRPAWVAGQLQLYRKLAPRRQKSPRLLAVVEAPPGPKAPLPIFLPGMVTVGIDRIAEVVSRALS
jgi:TIR domain